MKKTLFIILLALTVMLAYGSAYALTGVCSGCHTMHNSQDGASVATGDDGSTTTDTPNNNLTISTCIGCHNGGVAVAPNIFGTATQTAAGTFNKTVADAVSKLHNPADINSTIGMGSETKLLVTPGNDAAGLNVAPNDLTCAGTKGCHGDHTQAGSALGIKGFHHAARDTDRSSKGYRFLQNTVGTAIEGKGSVVSAPMTGWETGGAADDDHNVYNADANVGISSLCAACHGGFHGTGNTNASSPFVRHPTDNVIPAAWDATVAVTFDYNKNPFALKGSEFTDAAIDAAYDTDLTTYTAGEGPSVACVSCHRAHGSDQPDLLRFDYSGQIAGGGAGDTFGCLGCHTLQR
jgi:hypothetical protein